MLSAGTSLVCSGMPAPRAGRTPWEKGFPYAVSPWVGGSQLCSPTGPAGLQEAKPYWKCCRCIFQGYGPNLSFPSPKSPRGDILGQREQLLSSPPREQGESCDFYLCFHPGMKEMMIENICIYHKSN